jgi:hypothetical protein
MRRLELTVLAAMITLAPRVMVQTGSAASSSEEEELKNLDHKWLDSEKKYDVTFCRRFFADSGCTR